MQLPTQSDAWPAERGSAHTGNSKLADQDEGPATATGLAPPCVRAAYR